MNTIDDSARNTKDDGESGTEEDAKGRRRLPKVLMIVTGKGDLREKIMGEVIRLEREEKWEWVRCRSAWLSAADYPLLLGALTLLLSVLLCPEVACDLLSRFCGPGRVAS